MKISILIPARNEAKTIVEILHRVQQALRKHEHEIIVIDDGSQDDTAALVAQSFPGVKVFSLRPGRGKGAALRAGLELAGGEICIIQDADLEYDPTDYPLLLEPLLNGSAQVVYGSRILGASTGRQVGISSQRFYWGGQFLSWLTRCLYDAKITDIATGYKVFRTQLLRELKLAARSFEFCPEVTAKLLRKGVFIHEVPIAYAPRTIAEGKKIRWTDGAIAIWTLLKIRWS